jgi:hypothetical protein
MDKAARYHPDRLGAAEGTRLGGTATLCSASSGLSGSGHITNSFRSFDGMRDFDSVPSPLIQTLTTYGRRIRELGRCACLEPPLTTGTWRQQEHFLLGVQARDA